MRCGASIDGQSTADLPGAVTADRPRALPRAAPRVHCITNAVAQNFTANVLLAAGAIPSMTIAADEIGAFVARADALLVNLGTFDAERRGGGEMPSAAGERRPPWVLDPVFIDRSQPRTAYARTLVAQKPRAIRLNAAEFTALAEPDGATARSRTMRSSTRVWRLTGATDRHRRRRLLRIANGHPLMAASRRWAARLGAGRGLPCGRERSRWSRPPRGCLRSASRAKWRRRARADPAASRSRSSMRSTVSTDATLRNGGG